MTFSPAARHLYDVLDEIVAAKIELRIQRHRHPAWPEEPDRCIQQALDGAIDAARVAIAYAEHDLVSPRTPLCGPESEGERAVGYDGAASQGRPSGRNCRQRTRA